jgi:hypothetical protein
MLGSHTLVYIEYPESIYKNNSGLTALLNELSQDRKCSITFVGGSAVIYISYIDSGLINLLTLITKDA